VRLSGTEMQSLRAELGNVSAMLAEALGTKVTTPAAAVTTQTAPTA